MCLLLRVQLEEPLGERTKDISNIDGSLIVTESRNWRKPTGLLTLSTEGGCACSMLSDQADRDDKYWDFLPESLIALSITLEKIGDIFQQNFVFEALWIGDKPTVIIEISLCDMLKIIRNNRIGEKTRYLVHV